MRVRMLISCLWHVRSYLLTLESNFDMSKQNCVLKSSTESKGFDNFYILVHRELQISGLALKMATFYFT